MQIFLSRPFCYLSYHGYIILDGAYKLTPLTRELQAMTPKNYSEFSIDFPLDFSYTYLYNISIKVNGAF